MSRKTIQEVKSILDQIQFMDRKFTVTAKGDGFLIQLQYMENDIHTGKPELQKSRKWYCTSAASESEIVDTVYAACNRSMRHVVKENFLYKARRVYSPHFDIKARMELCDNNRFDDPGRKPKKTVQAVIKEGPKTLRTPSAKAARQPAPDEAPETLKCSECQEQVSKSRDGGGFCHRCGGTSTASTTEALECYF